MNCKVCNSSNTFSDGISVLCLKCESRFNLNAKNIDFLFEGGQDIPTDKKMLQRIENSKNRIKIIKNYINCKNYILVDIGSGSGEFLQEGKKWFTEAIGFEIDKTLIRYCESKDLRMYYGDFLREMINNFDNQNCFISISHVLEHIEDPINFLHKIVKNMNKGDILWLEIPLWTGKSFFKKKYNWKLWYEKHYYLFSSNIFQEIENNFDLKKIAGGERTFESMKFMRKSNILKIIFQNPFKSLRFLFLRDRERKGMRFLDFIFKDFGFSIFIKQ